MSTRLSRLALCLALASLGTAAVHAQTTATQSHVFTSDYALSAFGSFNNLTGASSFTFDGFATVAPGGTLNSVSVTRTSAILINGSWVNSSANPVTVTFSSTNSDESIKIGSTALGATWSTPFDTQVAITANTTLAVSETPTNNLFASSYTSSTPAVYNLFLVATVPVDFSNTISFNLTGSDQAATSLSGFVTVRDTVDITYNYTSAIPEPSTFVALAGAGVLGFALWRRRR